MNPRRALANPSCHPPGALPISLGPKYINIRGLPYFRSRGPCYDRVMNRVSARTAGKFSKALAKLYATDSEDNLYRATSSAVKSLFPGLCETEQEAWTQMLCANPENGAEGGPPSGRNNPILLELLWLHVIRCRLRLAGNAYNSLADGLPGKIDTRRLTARENQVLQRVALGETDAAIGRVLGITTKTVSKHVEHILFKLEVETRTAAVVRAHSSSAFPLQ
jgi:DNA-binding CsgD family transcriptional regulator